MLYSGNPVIIPEDDYMAGPVLSSGPDKQSAFSVRRIWIKTPNPDVALSKGGKPGYVAKLYLASVGAQTGMQGGKRMSVPPRQVGETSFRDVSELSLCQLSAPIDVL